MRDPDTPTHTVARSALLRRQRLRVLERLQHRRAYQAGRRGISQDPEGRGGGVDGADLGGEPMALANPRAPGDPGDEAILGDAAVVVAAVAAVIRRKDEECLAVEAGV